MASSSVAASVTSSSPKEAIDLLPRVVAAQVDHQHDCAKHYHCNLSLTRTHTLAVTVSTS